MKIKAKDFKTRTELDKFAKTLQGQDVVIEGKEEDLDRLFLAEGKEVYSAKIKEVKMYSK